MSMHAIRKLTTKNCSHPLLDLMGIGGLEQFTEMFLEVFTGDLQGLAFEFSS